MGGGGGGEGREGGAAGYCGEGEGAMDCVKGGAVGEVRGRELGRWRHCEPEGGDGLGEGVEPGRQCVCRGGGQG